MAKDPPEVPPRTRAQLQDQATPGTYLPESPDPDQMTGRQILESCGANLWFFQGKGSRDLGLSFTAEAVLDSLESSKRPDGTVEPICASLGPEYAARRAGRS
eukprot:2097154-Alexandrium_andersonii.AAC.1